MKKLIFLFLILPVISFSQSFNRIEQGNQPAYKLGPLNNKRIALQMEEIESNIITDLPLQSGMDTPVLLDSTHTYEFKSSNDSVLSDRTLYTYNPAGTLKIKSYYFWNDSLKKLLNDKYEYKYDRSGKLTSVIFNKWYFFHSDAYTTPDGVFHPEINNIINYSLKNEYTYDPSGNKTSDLSYVYDFQNSRWYLGERIQFFYNSAGTKTGMYLMATNDSQSNFKEEYTYDEKKNLATIMEYNQLAEVWLNTGKTKYEYTYNPQGKVTGLLSSYWSFKFNQWNNVSKVDYTYKSNGLLESRHYAIIDTTRNEMVYANKTDYTYNKIEKVILRKDHAWNETTSQWELRKKQYYYYNYSGPTVEINEISLNNDMSFRIFPNPAKDILWIENSGNSKTAFRLYNTKGQCVKMNVIDNGVNKINLGSLPKGIYIITIPLKNEIKSHKLIVE